MRAFVREVLLAIAAPVATEAAGAWREARAKEHDAAIKAREALAGMRGQSEPGK